MERREWIEKFELINDRKPTVSEMEEAEQKGEFETIIERQVQEQVAEAMRPTLKDKLFSVLKHLLKSLLKVLLLIIQSPILLVTFFLDFIKNLFFFWFVWFLSRPIFLWIAEAVASLFSKNPKNTDLYRVAENFFFGPEGMGEVTMLPTRDIDWIIILIASALFALLMLLPSEQKGES